MGKKNKNQPTELPVPKTRSQYTKMVKKGEFHYKNNRFVEALKFLTTAWKYDATSHNLTLMVADSLFRIGKKSAAMQLMAHALEAQPNDPTIASLLGNAALRMDFFDLAERFHQHHINLAPNDPIGHNNYVTALREQGKLDEAVEYLQTMLPIFPQSEIMWNSLGSVVAYRDGASDALIFYEECLKINPKSVQALNNIAPVYASMNEMEKSEKAIRKSIELDPIPVAPHIFLSTFLLDAKRLEEGWKEYQYRHNLESSNFTVRFNDTPFWQGEDLTGKSILVYGEQGVGDEILFTWLYQRIIDDAEEAGFACEPRLIPLFESSFPKAKISHYQRKITKDHDIEFLAFPDFDMEKYDYICPAGDLAKYYWPNYDAIPVLNQSFIKASDDKVNHWKERLAELPHKVSVGLSWRSGIKLAKRARNYAGILNWEPILRNKNVNFINLQYGDCEEDLAELEKETGLKIHTFDGLDLKDDFEDVVALMANLDMCLGPGSAPLMMSALSGRKTWGVMNGYPWWRFGDEVPKWCQNTKVYSKTDNEPWSKVMDICNADFKKWLDSK